MTKLEEMVKNTTGEARKALEELVHALASSIQENKKLTQENEYIKHNNKLLKKKLFGSASEKLKTDDICQQSDVFNEFELCAEFIEFKEPSAIEEKSST